MYVLDTYSVQIKQHTKMFNFKMLVCCFFKVNLEHLFCFSVYNEQILNLSFYTGIQIPQYRLQINQSTDTLKQHGFT